MNRVIISGRITKDLELKYTSNNNPVTLFTLAVKRTKEDSDFIQVVAYNKQAENVTKYCKKGSSINVVGRLYTRNYEDKDGKKVYVVEVIADEIEFVGNASEKKEVEEQEQLPF